MLKPRGHCTSCQLGEGFKFFLVIVTTVQQFPSLEALTRPAEGMKSQLMWGVVHGQGQTTSWHSSKSLFLGRKHPRKRPVIIRSYIKFSAVKATSDIKKRQELICLRLGSRVIRNPQSLFHLHDRAQHSTHLYFFPAATIKTSQVSNVLDWVWQAIKRFNPCWNLEFPRFLSLGPQRHQKPTNGGCAGVSYSGKVPLYQNDDIQTSIPSRTWEFSNRFGMVSSFATEKRKTDEECGSDQSMGANGWHSSGTCQPSAVLRTVRWPKIVLIGPQVELGYFGWYAEGRVKVAFSLRP